ncbi:hypothetical protein DL93DRAFT_2231218 [Clavulina sp. PMI_390]|nr:hypothetical protein DL93DRAFT_2231218 [Clavulina sp. PMI_390]
MILHKGAACLRCRRQKQKCDGLRPCCSRCNHLDKQCDYAFGIAQRRRATDALEARVLELEITILRLTLPSTHNLLLLSARLLGRIARLGDLSQPSQSLGVADSVFRRRTPDHEDIETERRSKEAPGEDSSVKDLWYNQMTVEQQLRAYSSTQLDEIDELPLTLSAQLINLFLPSRALYYFLVDVPCFVRRVLLPSSHPDSIHPCLLNACYLAACTSNGSRLTSFAPSFLRRTRRFLQHSLMFADRITHFMWASIVLSVFFARERRLIESIATASATTRFAFACGLNLPGNPVIEHDDSNTREGLLPLPKDQTEADDRVRLAHSIYLGVQAYPQLCGYPPTFPYEDWWSPDSREASLSFQNGKESWHRELYLRVLVTNTFERVKRFARSVAMNGYIGREEEYQSIEGQIYAQHAFFPSLYDPSAPRSIGPTFPFNTHATIGHVMLYGSGLVLHSLWAAHDPQSRAKMLECLQALIDICAHSRKHKRPHLGLVNIVHVMNAVRLIACELRRPETKENVDLTVSYCHSVESLLDFIDGTMIYFPAWVDSLMGLKDTLTAAATSLPT